MNKIKSFITNIQKNEIIRLVLYWSIVIFISLYVFSLPAFSARSGLNLISYFLMAALGGSTILYTVLYTKVKVNKFLFIPAAFVVFAFFGTLFYSHYYVGDGENIGWTTLLLMLITMVVFYYAFIAINNTRIILMAIALAFLVFGLYFIAFYFTKLKQINFRELRLGGDFDNVNTIGFYFSIAFTISLYIGLNCKKKVELLFLIAALLFLVLGFLTGSRAYVVVVFAGLICILFFKFKQKKWIFFLISAGLIASLLILINIPALSFLKDQFDRMLYTIFGIGNSKVDTSTVQRLIYPQYAWYLAGKNLIVGYGCNGFAIFSGVGTYAHNNYAEVMCNFGLIGFVIYFASFIIPTLYSFNPKEKDTYIVFTLVILYLVRSFFGVTYYSKDSYLILAICFYLTKDCDFITTALKSAKVVKNVDYYEVSI